MVETQKNSFFEKIKNNPFGACLAIVVVGVAVFVIYILSGAVNQKISNLESQKTTASTVAQTEALTETVAPQNILKTGTIKKYADTIEDVRVIKEGGTATVTVTFKDEEALLETHYAQNAFSIEIVPVFCFYLDNGLQVKIPGDYRLLNDSKSIVYYLSETEDFVNVVALSENVTVNVNNIMSRDFNIYLQHKSKDGVGRTVLGTYSQTVEEFNKLHIPTPADIVDKNEDIKLIETTACDEFMWVDIYFKDEATYLNYKSQFIKLGYEYGGKLYQGSYITTDCDKLYMIRCKLDAYTLSQLLKAMNKEGQFTVKEFFEEFGVSVWATDYKNGTDLFWFNEHVDVRERLNKSTAVNE